MLLRGGSSSEDRSYTINYKKAKKTSTYFLFLICLVNKAYIVGHTRNFYPDRDSIQLTYITYFAEAQLNGYGEIQQSLKLRICKILVENLKSIIFSNLPSFNVHHFTLR